MPYERRVTCLHPRTVATIDKAVDRCPFVAISKLGRARSPQMAESRALPLEMRVSREPNCARASDESERERETEIFVASHRDDDGADKILLTR